MITLIILLIALIITIVVAAITLVTGGVGLLVVFGDAIVAVVVIALIVKHFANKGKSKKG